MRYVGNVRRFVRLLDVDLAGMEPCDHLVSAGWCYGSPGEERIVYLPDGGPVRLAGLPERYRASWFDPREGTVTAASGAPAFVPPEAGDWALHVVAVD